LKQTIRERRQQIQRDFAQLKSLGWDAEDIYEELGRRYFISPETARQNVHSLGGYADEDGKGVKDGDI